MKHLFAMKSQKAVSLMNQKRGCSLALLAGLCLRDGSGSDSAGEKKEPVFEAIPSLTAPLPTPAVRVAAAATNPTPAPNAAPLPSPTPEASPVPADQGKGKTLYSFQAADLELKAALATFARANELNIVPDHDVTGTVTLDVRNLPLDQM